MKTLIKICALLVLLWAGACKPAKEVTRTKVTTTVTHVPVVVKADSADVAVGPVNTRAADSLDAARLSAGLDSTFTGYQRRAVAARVLDLLRTRVRWGSRDTAFIDTAGVRVKVYRDAVDGRVRTRILRKVITIPGQVITRVDSVQTTRLCPELSPHDQMLLRVGRWLPLPGSGWRGAVTGIVAALILLFLLLRRLMPR